MKTNNDEKYKLRARLIVEGDVQGVAYRAHIKRIARVQKIRGIVRNLEDDRVEIFCECDKKTLQKFKRLISKKRENIEDIFSPHVEDIKVYKEQEKEYKDGDPPKEFKAFNIDYGVKLNSFEEESLTRTEIGSLLLIDNSKKTAIVGQKVEGMHNDMIGSFDRINEKYDSFGKDLKIITDCFKELVQYFTKKDTAKKK